MIPTGVEPDYSNRDADDLRKVIILGGDDNASMGCIIGLRKFQYDG